MNEKYPRTDSGVSFGRGQNDPIIKKFQQSSQSHDRLDTARGTPECLRLSQSEPHRAARVRLR